jgi:cytochrome c-type biogenesis protein CcmE
MSAGRRRGPLIALTTLVVLAVGILVASGLQGTLVYYRTPTEILDQRPPHGERIRLGGQVLPGSLREADGETSFRLADATHQIPVVQHGAPPGTFKEGRDAVVEGVLGADGVFTSDTVMVKHSNEYRPRESSG